MENVTSKHDKWIPWYFVAFFVVLAILDLIFVFIATSTHTGVITEQAYQQGLQYNQVIKAAEQQKQLGWQSDIHVTGRTIYFHLQDKRGIPIKDANVVAYFIRPSQDGMDFSMPLEYNSEGNYSKHIPFPKGGLWNVRILATWNQQHYQISKPIIIR